MKPPTKRFLTAGQLILLPLLVASCATSDNSISLKDFPVQPLKAKSFTGKRVAIALERSKVPDDSPAAKENSVVHFDDAADALIVALQKHLSEETKLIEVYKFKPIPMGRAADFYIYPELSIVSAKDFWSGNCVIRYEVSLYDKNRRLIANKEGEGKRTFTFAGQAEPKCKEAMADVFAKVNAAVFD